MAAEVEERIMQKMSEGNNDQDATERDERVARAQPNNDQHAGDQFNEWNSDADGPERPSRQKCIAEWQEILSGMLERTKLKYFHDAGHKKDQAENESGEEESPRAIKSCSHG